MRTGVSLLVKRILRARMDLVHVNAGRGGRLIMDDIAENSSLFRIVAVYAPKGLYFVFPSVRSIPGGFAALNLNGGLECYPGPYYRQGVWV